MGSSSAVQRFAFRFLFVFLSLIATYAFVALPGGYFVPTAWFFDGLQKALTLLAHAIHMDPSGNVMASDAGMAYFFTLVEVVTALGVASVWSARATVSDHRQLHDRLRMIVRYALASVMFLYGSDKLFRLQFWFPTPSALIETFADSSPTGILWRSIGTSAFYSMFTGAVEMLGAVLLFWRRTTTLGALILAGALSNVVALNIGYGIGVMFFAMQLLALALFLLAPDVRRLIDVLVLHRAVAATSFRPFPLAGRAELARRISKAVLLSVFVAKVLYHDGAHMRRNAATGGATPHALWGVYDVEEFQRDGHAVPLLAGDAKLWHQLGFGDDWGADVCIVTMDESRHLYDIEHDETKSELTINIDDKPQKFALRRPDDTHLELEGEWLGDKIAVKLHLRDMSGSRIYQHPFTWVNNAAGNPE